RREGQARPAALDQPLQPEPVRRRVPRAHDVRDLPLRLAQDRLPRPGPRRQEPRDRPPRREERRHRRFVQEGPRLHPQALRAQGGQMTSGIVWTLLLATLAINPVFAHAADSKPAEKISANGGKVGKRTIKDMIALAMKEGVDASVDGIQAEGVGLS